MKNSLILVILFFNSLVLAQSTEEEIFLSEQDLNLLNLVKDQRELTIDHIDEHGFEVYGPKGTSKWLESIGASPFKVQHREIKRQGDYPSARNINNTLRKIQRDFPNIVKLINIGKSVKGVELIALKISDNVNIDEREPEFKYIGNMHGNEIVGRDMLVEFIAYLVSSYENGDPRIKKLIDNTEIYILPSMNPDGADRRRRGNANRVDLNRNFPDFSTRDNRDEIKNRQPEVVSVMKWQRKRNFSLSANFHGGTKVVNYPWDTSKDPAPLTNLIKSLSRTYAATVPGFFDSNRYEDGIVNGNSWYEVNGGMQDWSYFYHNDLQVTIELSHSKWPRYSEIPQFFRENKEALIRYIEKVHQGIGFAIPEVSTIEILNDQGKSLGNFAVKNGEFYKVLPEGNFTIRYQDPKSMELKSMARVSNQEIDPIY